MVCVRSWSDFLLFRLWYHNFGLLETHFVQLAIANQYLELLENFDHSYRVTRSVFSKSVKLKLHLLFKKNLAGYLKTHKVTRISAVYVNFSHPPVHSGPIYFSKTKKFEIALRDK